MFDLLFGKKEIAQLKSELSEAGKIILALRKELSEAKETISALQQEPSKAKDTILALREKLSEARGTISVLQEEPLEVKDEILALQKELSEAKKSCLVANKSIARYEQRNTYLYKECVLLRETNKNLRIKNSSIAYELKVLGNVKVDADLTLKMQGRLCLFEELIGKKLDNALSIESFVEKIIEKERVVEAKYNKIQSLEYELPKQEKRIEEKRKMINTRREALEQDKKEHEEECRLFELYNPQYKWVIENREEIHAKKRDLACIEEKVQKIRDSLNYDTLLDEEFRYKQRRERLTEKQKQLAREEKWVESEKAVLTRQLNRFYDENTEAQRRIYEEIEENDHLLFVLRSFKKLSPLYHVVVDHLVASLGSDISKRVVARYLKGESIYEIARNENRASHVVKRMIIMSIKKLDS